MPILNEKFRILFECSNCGQKMTFIDGAPLKCKCGKTYELTWSVMEILEWDDGGFKEEGR